MQSTLEFDAAPAATSLIPSSAGTDYEVVSYFPWRYEDCSTLNWDEFIWSNERRAHWKVIVQKWTGVAAVCGRTHHENKILLVRTTPSQPLLILGRLAIEVKGEAFRALCWSIHNKTLAPLLLLGGLTGNIYIYDVESRLITSVLRGHGGRITSLHAHPQNPQIIASTSRDTTSRMWRLNLSQSDIIKHSDPHKARLGPPFGAPLTNEAEAIGMGRCILVTEGGMVSDGHKSTVLDAVRGLLLGLADFNRLFKDFHPTLNLLVTSSEDHFVKIWLYEPLAVTADGAIVHTNLTRPVFATGNLHHASVICVHWLSAAILISQSTHSMSDGEHTFPGMLVVWKWLGRVHDALANGCEYVKSSIDALESDSYKILAEIPIAQDAAKLSFSEKLAILTTSSMIRIIDPFQLQPRPAPKTLTAADIPYEDEQAWKKILNSRKQEMNDRAKNDRFPGVVATIELNDEWQKETTYNAAMYSGLLLRVGTNERLIVWKMIGI